MIIEKSPMYKPLPKELRLGFSEIHDMGLFTKKDLEKGTNFGMTHLKLGDKLIRTPLGAFINHSDDPNCYKAKLRYTEGTCHYCKWNLITLKDIKEDEELTLKYTFYKI